MRRTHGGTAAALAAALLLVLVTACASVVAGEDSGAASPASTATAGEIDAPPPGGAFDYQLGGAYAPPTGVTVVVRDRTAAPAGAGYDVCYVNGFQTQPGESDSFADEHPELLVTVDGSPLADPGWPDEYLFDTSSAEKRSALVTIVGTGSPDAPRMVSGPSRQTTSTRICVPTVSTARAPTSPSPRSMRASHTPRVSRSPRRTPPSTPQSCAPPATTSPSPNRA